MMTRFAAYDGTMLAYRRLGAGPPLVCLPGGPGLTPEYLGDLGGLARSRELILPDTRGTGGSDAPADPLQLDRMDLLGHSAAGNLAVLYAAAHPDRLAHLVLVTPGVKALGLEPDDDEQQLAVMERRSGEPWYPRALAAALAANAGDDSVENRRAYAPFFYGRWDEAARAHAELEFEQRAPAVESGYYAAGAFGPEATRAALAAVTAPALVHAGELDIGPWPELAAEAAAIFPNGKLVVQPGAGHFPWLDDPAWFAAAVTDFLS